MLPLQSVYGTIATLLLTCDTTVPSSYNCTHACDFARGTTRFYSVSEVQIHAWFSAWLQVLSQVCS